MRVFFKIFAVVFAICFAVGIAIRLIILPFFAFDKQVERKVANFDAETAAQVYDNSRVYQQGMQNDINNYYVEWTKADNVATKMAITGVISGKIAHYNGPLSDLNKHQLAEMGINF